MFKYILLCSLLGLSVGCAQGLMKVSDDQAYVCLGDKDVKVGDRVTLYKQVCKGAGGKTEDSAGCEMVKKSGATVLETLNDHYSVIKVDSGVEFVEGTIVEKDL
jgi:hypothetical protein